MLSRVICFVILCSIFSAQDVLFNNLGMALVWVSESSEYEIAYLGRSEFLHITHTSNHDISVTLIVDGFVMEQQSSPSFSHITLTPENLPTPCPDDLCSLTVRLVVNMSATAISQHIPVQLEKGLMLQPGLVIADSLILTEKRRYGYYLRSENAPVLIDLVPDQSQNNVDLDLFGYHESSYVYFFPNMNEQNHINGYVESILLSTDKSYFVDNSMYFIEVYASTDSSVQVNSYQIVARNNWTATVDWFDYYIFGFIIIVASAFIFSLVLSVACGYIHAVPAVRSRIFYWLRLRDNPNPNGASKADLRRIEVVALDELTLDLEEDLCSICLDVFEDESPISRLPCTHIFHKACSETWLRRNKTCPLCKHDITRPHNEVVDEEGGSGSTAFQRLDAYMSENFDQVWSLFRRRSERA